VVIPDAHSGRLNGLFVRGKGWVLGSCTMHRLVACAGAHSRGRRVGAWGRILAPCMRWREGCPQQRMGGGSVGMGYWRRIRRGELPLRSLEGYRKEKSRGAKAPLDGSLERLWRPHAFARLSRFKGRPIGWSGSSSPCRRRRHRRRASPSGRRCTPRASGPPPRTALFR
jgi:hypothetical protein